MADLTNKKIDFLSNEKHINILRSILDELDFVASYGANRSTTYLAVSAIEGLFDELFILLRVEPSSVPQGKWPTYRDKNCQKQLKSIEHFTLEEKGNILNLISALPSDFNELYDKLRIFRNYIHTAVELRKPTPITQSIGQLALACLNALIELYSPVRFVAGQQWRLVHGLAQVPEDDVIHLPSTENQESLLVSVKEAGDFQEMTFRVIMSPRTILNLVYNYFSPDNFMAARIEGRPEYVNGGNGRLVCTKWHAWSISDQYVANSEPDPQKREHIIRVFLGSPGTFSVVADQQPLMLANAGWDFNPAGKVGFMTQLGLVSVLDLKVQS